MCRAWPRHTARRGGGPPVGAPGQVDGALPGDSADEGEPPPGQGEVEGAASIPVGIEGEPGRQGPEAGARCSQDRAREATAMGGHREFPVRPGVVVPKEPGARAAHGRQIGTAVSPQHTVLPQAIEALDVRVPPRLPQRDEPPVHPEEEAQAHDLGEREAMGIPPPMIPNSLSSWLTAGTPSSRQAWRKWAHQASALLLPW